MSFREINVRDVKANAVKLISNDWMLVTSGGEDCCNTMTASWGTIGEMWGKDVVFTPIRPQRYTYEFLEKNDTYSLCFFGDEFKEKLTYCGTKSGRDVDKIAECGLEKLYCENTTYFNQASLVLICKKMAFQDVNPDGFIDPNIEKNYANKDYHRMYIGEILKVLIKD